MRNVYVRYRWVVFCMYWCRSRNFSRNGSPMFHEWFTNVLQGWFTNVPCTGSPMFSRDGTQCTMYGSPPNVCIIMSLLLPCLSILLAHSRYELYTNKDESDTVTEYLCYVVLRIIESNIRVTSQRVSNGASSVIGPNLMITTQLGQTQNHKMKS